jgi:flagellin
MQSEYDALGNQLSQIMANTSFGGMNLLSGDTSTGALATAITFQIGATTSETFTLDLSAGFTALQAAFTAASSNYSTTGAAVTTAGTELATGSAAVGTVRSALGAAANRLDHIYHNLQNQSTNTIQATSRIMDVDYASETANQTTQSMLAQAGTAMLKQSGQMSQMVMSLLQ